jgi:hypothetical protein
MQIHKRRTLAIWAGVPLSYSRNNSVNIHERLTSGPAGINPSNIEILEILPMNTKKGRFFRSATLPGFTCSFLVVQTRLKLTGKVLQIAA